MLAASWYVCKNDDPAINPGVCWIQREGSWQSGRTEHSGNSPSSLKQHRRASPQPSALTETQAVPLQRGHFSGGLNCLKAVEKPQSTWEQRFWRCRVQKGLDEETQTLKWARDWSLPQMGSISPAWSQKMGLHGLWAWVTPSHPTCISTILS